MSALLGRNSKPDKSNDAEKWCFWEKKMIGFIENYFRAKIANNFQI